MTRCTVEAANAGARYSSSVRGRFLEQHASRVDAEGRRLVVRNGSLPARQILTSAGSLEIAQPRVRDKSPELEERLRFSSSILPPYLRKSKSLEELIPWLFLKGISTGDFSEALQALLGPEANGLSANVIVRLLSRTISVSPPNS